MKSISRDIQLTQINTRTPLTPVLPSLTSYHGDEEGMQELEAICRQGALQVLAQTPSTQIIDKYRQLVAVLHDLLAGQQPLPSFRLQEALEGLIARNPLYKGHCELLRISLTALKDILTGKIQATSVIFPNGSLDYVSAVYKGSPESDYFNNILSDVVAETVAAALSQLPAGEKIRLLEVGAGTGGSSAFIFKKLQPYSEQIEYTYTDISRSFLIHAETNFQSAYLKTALFDISVPGTVQGLPAGYYDMVIAANVIHATPEIARTLQHIKPLMKKDGLLVLNELAVTRLYSTLTFGLLEGWWLYEDKELRLAGSPGLSFEKWQTVLDETGFTNTTYVPVPAGLSQQIIISSSNGFVKIPQEKKGKPAPAKPLVKQHIETPHSEWLIQQLINIAADTIKLPREEFNVDEQFLDYGFDSILGNNLMKNINECFKINLKATDIFSYPNIGQLAIYIQEAFSEELSAVYKGEAPAQITSAPAQITPAPAHVTLAPTPIPVRPIPSPVATTTDIAIIGISCQFGTANNAAAFWEALRDGRQLTGEVPASRWDVKKYFSESRNDPDKTYSKWGAFLNDVDKFDPLFFKISGHEAEMMDPQQRLFLEHSWKALEDAGINPKGLQGNRCGVYVGVGASDYLDTIAGCHASAFWGNSSSVLASRISYFLDLKGPAISIDTACSSSLVAMNLACTSLQQKDTDIVISGGITIINSVDFYLLAGRAGMLSPNGQCYAFDKRADGFVPGEGVGVVVMKRLEDAERDGDHIYGVIKGSLTNQDGTTNGIFAPSALSQRELEKEVYTKFNIHPDTISYVEAHGTGTSLGDPIEFEALTAAFRHFTDKKQYCGIGSVKTNIGHTLMAAGVAGVMKVLLSMKHGQLPPTINYSEPNPLLELGDSPFRIQQQLEPWHVSAGTKRRAAISSFGFSGTNAHMVIEEYIPAPANTYLSEQPAVIVLSAKDKDRLKEQVTQFITFLQQEDLNLYDIAYTLQTGREAMEERLAVVAHTKAQVIAALNDQYYSGTVRMERKGTVAADPHQLAQAFVNGIRIDWSVLYEGNYPRKISLPVYPFARESYWATSQTAHTTQVLTGNEWFFAGHKAGNTALLPGVYYLETGRKAAGKQVYQLREVKWLKPLQANGHDIHLQTQLSASGAYEISSEAGIHSQGIVVTTPVTPPEQNLYNIPALRASFTNMQTGTACYELFAAKGLHYGKGLQGIQTLYYHQEAALSLIESGTREGILDSALQTCAALGMYNGDTGSYLPYSVKAISLYAELPARVWAYVVKTPSHFDIYLLDETGRLLLTFEEMVAVLTAKPTGLQMYQVGWGPATDQAVLDKEGMLILLAGASAELAEILQDRLEVEVDILKGATPDACYGELLQKVKSGISQDKPGSIVVVCSNEDYRDYGFLSGLLKTASLECPRFKGKLIGVPALNVLAADRLTEILSELSGAAEERVTITREEKVILPFNTKRAADNYIKQGGVYLITGGAGALGRAFAAHLHSKGNVQVILAGRSEQPGIYQCDVSDRNAVQSLMTMIRNTYGRLDGIIHCAGQLHDQLILNSDSHAAVLAAKVNGTIHLDIATRDFKPDFTVYCSSISAIKGNVGQAAYAAANAFMDNYALEGHQLSINWSLWEGGGMHLDEDGIAAIARRWGIAPMPVAKGLEAFDQLLGSGTTGQVLVTYSAATAREMPRNIETAAELTIAAGQYFRKLLADELKFPVEKVTLDAPFEKYGIDSIIINNLTNRLDEIFGKVPRTLFFEYQQLSDLVDYFVAEHTVRMQELTGISATLQVSQPAITITEEKQHNKEDIAIIGLSGRYPGADNLSQFWENLAQGKDCITEIPADRWELKEFYDKEKGRPGRSYSKWGGFISDVDKFDSLFFNISPREAALMDPQERLFLETVWSTLEDAGYTREQISRRVGVYVGVMYEEYPLLGIEEREKGNFVTPGGSPGSIANRVSYFFNFQGPSIALDTMCSSSLTAIHLACESLYNGSIDYAIAGGVNVSIHPNKYLMLSQGRFVSEKGHCESFGEGGDGYVPGEGVGAVLLKPLSKAIADGDHIYGLIRSTAVNHGGKTNSYTVPNPRAQSSLITEALQKAGLDSASITYIEAHGTGTSLGDPIEIAGLVKAFDTTQKQYCSIGSVKSNIGHAESAAGISGLTKVLLQMQHRQLVPSLHSQVLNPHIDFANSPFKVQQSLAPWEDQRNAGISSFGAGGSNAHLIVSAYISDETPITTGEFIIPLSAKNRERLKELVTRILTYLQQEVSLYDMAFTLQTGREALDERLAVTVTSQSELIVALKAYLAGDTTHTGHVKRDTPQPGDSLAATWAKGGTVNWASLYNQRQPRRLSLPTYPFAKERHWIAQQSATHHQLHALLHTNESIIGEQRFKSTYTGREHFLADHQVNNEKIFPGVAYLELAREAGTRSTTSGITQLKEVTWLSPMKVNGIPVDISIHLTQQGENIRYEVRNSEVIHNQGLLSKKELPPLPLNHPDLIRDRLTASIEKGDYYNRMQGLGLQYGSSFQGIEKVYYNDHEALSYIRLPQKKEYVLSPGIMDSALQTCVALGITDDALQPGLPFSVKEVNIYQSPESEVWCYARKTHNGKLVKYDIDLLDKDGQVLVNLKELVVLPVQQPAATLLYAPVWKREKATIIPADGNSLLISDQDHLPLPGTKFNGGDIPDGLTNVFIALQDEIAVFNSIKLLLHTYKNTPLNITVFTQRTQKVLPADKVAVQGAGIPGFIGSLAREQSSWNIRVIDIDQFTPADIRKALSIPYSRDTSLAALRKGHYYKRQLVPMYLAGGHTTPLKEGGVYVILGGAGGIGKVTTAYLIRKYKAQVIWLGRRAADAAIQTSQQEMAAYGPSPVYISCDATNAQSMEKAAQQIQQQFTTINGLFHSAIVLNDMPVDQMDVNAFQSAFAPKSVATRHFINAFKHLQPDFICFYSSAQSQLNAPGQSNYAAGCTYADSYALSLEHTPVRIINWGFWGDVGIVSAASYNKRMAALGIAGITAAEGMNILETALSNDIEQIAAIKFI